MNFYETYRFNSSCYSAMVMHWF